MFKSNSFVEKIYRILLRTVEKIVFSLLNPVMLLYLRPITKSCLGTALKYHSRFSKTRTAPSFLFIMNRVVCNSNLQKSYNIFVRGKLVFLHLIHKTQFGVTNCSFSAKHRIDHVTDRYDKCGCCWCNSFISWVFQNLVFSRNVANVQ